MNTTLPVPFGANVILLFDTDIISLLFTSSAPPNCGVVSSTILDNPPPPPPPEASAPSHFPFVELYLRYLPFTLAVEVSTSSKSLTNTAPPPPSVDSCLCMRFKNNL